MKTFIFDLYNTLIDMRTDEHDPASWTKAVKFFADMGYATDEHTLIALYDEGWKNHLYELEKSARYAYPEGDILEVYKYMARHIGCELSSDRAKALALLARRESVRKIELFDGTSALFKDLRALGAKLYLLSNAQSVFTLGEISECGLTDAFDGMLLSSDCGCRKPDKAYFQMLFDKYKLDKTDAVMVGDDPFADGKGARDFGIEFVLADGGAAAHADILKELALRK